MFKKVLCACFHACLEQPTGSFLARRRRKLHLPHYQEADHRNVGKCLVGPFPVGQRVSAFCIVEQSALCSITGMELHNRRDPLLTFQPGRICSVTLHVKALSASVTTLERSVIREVWDTGGPSQIKKTVGVHLRAKEE